MLHHLCARVAVLLARRRVRAARGPLAARLRPQRAQRRAHQRQPQQRGAHAYEHGGRGGAPAGRGRQGLRAVVALPAVRAVAHVVRVGPAALLAPPAVQARARAVAFTVAIARVLQRALVAAEAGGAQTPAGQTAVSARRGSDGR